MYPHGKIVWNGVMKTGDASLSFACHMTKLTLPRIQIKFILGQGDINTLEIHIQDLVDCLNKYETESDWVTKTNGWTQPEII